MRCSDSLRQVSSSFDICFSQCETNLPVSRIDVLVSAEMGLRGTDIFFLDFFHCPEGCYNVMQIKS